MDVLGGLPMIVLVHVLVLGAIALCLARVLPRYFQRRRRED